MRSTTHTQREGLAVLPVDRIVTKGRKMPSEVIN